MGYKVKSKVDRSLLKMIARKKMPVEGNEDVRFGAEQRSEIEDSQERRQVDGTYNN